MPAGVARRKAELGGVKQPAREVGGMMHSERLPELKVSAYDRVAGWVIALNILVGFSVGLGFLVWLSHVLEFTPDQVPVTLVENIAGRGDHAAGFERDFEPPGVDELEDLTEPQVESLLEQVTNVVSTQAAALDTLNTEMLQTAVGGGLGDSRPPGPLGEGEDIIPRFERWEIRYNATGLDAYAQQLDFFGIELGVVGGGRRQIDYARQFRGGRPLVRQAAGDTEKRLYMTWTSGALRRFDQQLLQAAGIDTANRIVVQFYPPEVENQLAAQELAHAQANGMPSVRDIRRTVFGVRRQGAGFEYYVISQAYRATPGGAGDTS
jgi:hypothetical protein